MLLRKPVERALVIAVWAVLLCLFVGYGVHLVAAHKPAKHVAATVVIPKKKAVPKPTPKPATPAATPPKPAVPTPVATTKVYTKPTPVPAPASAPTPGNGVKSLQPVPPSGSSGSTGSTGSTGSSGSSGSSGSTGGSGGGTPTDYASTNWSGYMANTASYTGISGSWTVPRTTGNGTGESDDSAWIGIGGVSTSDLIQTGTLDTVDASGVVTDYGFYELLPDSALLIQGFPISAGDSMSADIHKTGTNTWSISLTDNTTGKNFTTSVTYASTLSSAEWIEEDPSNNSGLMPLDKFGSVTFSGGLTTAGGATENLNQAVANPITLVDGSGNPLATTSALSSGGDGFTVTQK